MRSCGEEVATHAISRYIHTVVVTHLFTSYKITHDFMVGPQSARLKH